MTASGAGLEDDERKLVVPVAVDDILRGSNN
jgi:hypothetical protein